MGKSLKNRASKTGAAVVLGVMCIGIAWVAPAFAGNATYQYDALGRVTKVTYPDNKQICYAYDPAGNRTQVKRQATSTCTPPAITLTTSTLLASSPVEMSAVAENAAEAITTDTAVEPSQETTAPDSDSAAASF